ncbi:MAG TPA: hypothetical protein VMM13_11560, partial [Euzebya sp.]|nr:hypothetical protein [Euzebya sp.]
MSHAPDLTSRRFPADGGAATSYDVLEGGSAGDPSVILMHELFGISESLLTLVGQLIAAGYRVHVPVLYGDREVTGLPRGAW